MVCCMALEENIDEGNETQLNDDPSYDDLLCVVEETYEDVQKIIKKK